MSPVGVRASETDVVIRPGPAEINAKLVEWSKQIENFSMRWEVTRKPLTPNAVPPASPQNDYQVKEVVWTKEGRFWSHKKCYLEPKCFTRDLLIYDTQIEYRAEYAEGFSVLHKPARLRFGLWTTTTNSDPSLLQFLPLEGLWDSFRLRWGFLGFSASEVECQSEELQQGRYCPLIKFHDGSQVLYDPERNFLPRRIQQSAAGESMLYVVESFQKVGPDLWFPVAGYQQRQSSTDPQRNFFKRWHVTEVKINQAIPNTAFQIKPVAGTEVVDTLTGYTFIYGWKMPQGTLESGLNQLYLNHLKFGGPSPFPLRPQPTLWQQWRYVLLLTGLVVCIVILAWRTLLPKGIL